MSSHRQNISLLFIVLMIGGCASMTQEECETVEWFAVGYEDGKQGRPTQNVSRHEKACSKFGVTPDIESYLTGWDDGVLSYCTREGGFNAGSKGRKYAGVCPEGLERRFLVAYKDGHHLYMLRSEVERIESAISWREQRIRTINKKLRTFRGSLSSPDKTDKQRKNTKKRIRELTKEKRELKDETYDLRSELRDADDRYKDYRSDIATQYLY
jgi:hypothetical protein